MREIFITFSKGLVPVALIAMIIFANKRSTILGKGRQKASAEKNVDSTIRVGGVYSIVRGGPWPYGVIKVLAYKPERMRFLCVSLMRICLFIPKRSET
jgi:hypothetical protein